MSVEKVREYLNKFNASDRIIELDGDISTVYLAAQSLSVTEGEIAKSLSFKIGDEAIIVVMKGDARVDNSKYRHRFNTKARMLSFDEVDEMIGHKVGGVCPFGINEGVKVYLDVSLKKYDYVYPACGSCNSCIKLSIEELELFSNYCEWVDIAKDSEAL